MSALSHPGNVILLQQLKLMKTAGKAQTAVFVGLALWYPILIFHSEPSELRDGGSSIPCKPSCSVDSVVPGPVALDSKVDATGEDLPSRRENVALSAFCFYGFFFFFFGVKKSVSGDIFS